MKYGPKAKSPRPVVLPDSGGGATVPRLGCGPRDCKAEHILFKLPADTSPPAMTSLPSSLCCTGWHRQGKQPHSTVSAPFRLQSVHLSLCPAGLLEPDRTALRRDHSTKDTGTTSVQQRGLRPAGLVMLQIADSGRTPWGWPLQPSRGEETSSRPGAGAFALAP